MPSVVPQPGEEDGSNPAHGYVSMTGALPKGVHLEMLNMYSQSVAFPFWPFGEYSSHASLEARQAMCHISTSLGKILRHHIGGRRDYATCNCGGWVNIEETLRRNDIFPREWYNKRLIAMQHERSGRKPRFQILAAGCDQEIHRAGLERSSNPDQINTSTASGEIRSDGGSPGASGPPQHIRTSSSRGQQSGAVLNPVMSEKLGGSYHVTRTSVYVWRLATHFNIFAPWDPENVSTKTSQRGTTCLRSAYRRLAYQAMSLGLCRGDSRGN